MTPRRSSPSKLTRDRAISVCRPSRRRSPRRLNPRSKKSQGLRNRPQTNLLSKRRTQMKINLRAGPPCARRSASSSMTALRRRRLHLRLLHHRRRLSRSRLRSPRQPHRVAWVGGRNAPASKAYTTPLPGLTRQSIFFEMMDARIKSAHDALGVALEPARNPRDRLFRLMPRTGVAEAHERFAVDRSEIETVVRETRDIGIEIERAVRRQEAV